MMPTRRAIGGLFGGLALAPIVALGDAAPLRAELAWFARMVGTWKGEGDGEPGHSTVSRSYEVSWGGTFLIAHNQSVYAPQPKNPKGEVHDDMSVYSFDKRRKVAVLRQFDVEGFVNQFTAPAATLTGDLVMFETEAIENIPPGFKARETYIFHGDDVFEEVFEIAEPQKEFAIYSHNHLTRA
jgi:hypothetical protein